MTVSGSGAYIVTPNSIIVNDGIAVIDGLGGGFIESVQRFEVGQYSGLAGALTLTGGGSGVSITIEDPNTIPFSATVKVGGGGNGVLDINNGAQVISRSNSVYDPFVFGSDGGTTFGSYRNVDIGYGGDGEVNISGTGSFLGAYGVGARITVGRLGGNDGALNITDGARAGNLSMVIGRDGATGSVMVDGPDSVLTISNEYGFFDSHRGTDNSGEGGALAIGRSGYGDLSISNGGLVIVENLDGTTNGAFISVGLGETATGSITVTGDGSELRAEQHGYSEVGSTLSSNFAIGRSGQGAVVIEDNGTVNVLGDYAFASLGNRIGLSDGGAPITDAENTLTIRSGGTLNVDSGLYRGGGLSIAFDTGSAGSVEVTGATSAINIRSDGDGTSSGAFLRVGQRGEGELLVLDGADVSVDGNGDQFASFIVGVAAADGSSAGAGSARVSGAGSTVIVGSDGPGGGFIAVGRRAGAEGKLTIEDGGLVRTVGIGASGIEIAGGAPGDAGFTNSIGTALVTGAGSRLQTDRQIAVGADIIDADGNVDTSIGGDGRLRVAEGGAAVAGQIIVGDFGVLEVAEGKIDADLVVTGQFHAGGEDEISQSNIVGDFTQTSGSLFVEFAGAGPMQNDLITVDGDVTVDDSTFNFDLSGLSNSDLSVGDEIVFLSATGALSATLNGSATFSEPPVGASFEVIDTLVVGNMALALRIVSVQVNLPPIAVDDAFRTTEADAIASSLIANDDATDGPSFVLSNIAGSIVINQTPITLSSGAIVTANSDGTFIYDPNSVFDELFAGESSTDSFVYTLSDEAGETAQATAVFTIDGLARGSTTAPSDGDDILVFASTTEPVFAGAGNDTVTGGVSDDSIFGGAGEDNIRGSGGDDRIRGNSGDDNLRGNGGADNIGGGGGNDTIRGNGGADNIKGNGGADLIKAGGGADIVKGGGGSDNINGGGGSDQLNGGGGNDTITGKGGDDTLKGNGGADVFQFRTSDRNDTILDFRQGQDKIEIQNGARSFEALSIEQDGRDVLVGFGAGQVRVVTDNAGAFDESDFIF